MGMSLKIAFRGWLSCFLFFSIFLCLNSASGMIGKISLWYKKTDD